MTTFVSGVLCQVLPNYSPIVTSDLPANNYVLGCLKSGDIAQVIECKNGGMKLLCKFGVGWAMAKAFRKL